MGLIKCDNCRQEISDKTSYCIHCGFPTHPKANKKQFELGKKHKKIIVISLILIVIILALVLAINFNSKQEFINSYIGGYNTPLINNTWIKKHTSFNNELIYTEKIIFYDNYTCDYSLEYKDATFTFGDQTLPHFNKSYRCYYKVDYNNDNSNDEVNEFNITIYKLDLSEKTYEIIHSLHYHNYPEYKQNGLSDNEDVYEPNFTAENEINKTSKNTNPTTTNNKNIEATIKSINYDEYKRLLEEKNTFVLIVANNYKYSINYKNALSKIIGNYSTPFYLYEVDYDDNELNITTFPTTLIIQNGSIADSFEGFVENETINTLNDKLIKLGLK